MKTLTTVAFICLLLTSCKKDSKSENLTVKVSNLPVGTTYEIHITDKKNSSSILVVENGNGSYNHVAGVVSGEQLNIEYGFAYTSSPINSATLDISTPSKTLFHTETAAHDDNLIVTVP